jgi:hypothetical protein
MLLFPNRLRFLVIRFPDFENACSLGTLDAGMHNTSYAICVRHGK